MFPTEPFKIKNFKLTIMKIEEKERLMKATVVLFDAMRAINGGNSGKTRRIIIDTIIDSVEDEDVKWTLDQAMQRKFKHWTSSVTAYNDLEKKVAELESELATFKEGLKGKISNLIEEAVVSISAIPD